MTLTPSSRVYAICPPVITAKKLGSSNSILLFLTLSLINFFNFNKFCAPLSISLFPNLNSIRAYLPSFKYITASASSPLSSL